MEKFIFRRQPLGSDRFNRRYWWGLAGVRGAVIAERMPDASGTPTVNIITDPVRPHPWRNTSRTHPPLHLRHELLLSLPCKRQCVTSESTPCGGRPKSWPTCASCRLFTACCWHGLTRGA